MRAGIAVDDWKLPVFRRRLTNAGYTYEDAGEMTPGVTILHVEFTSVKHLADTIQECVEECAENPR